MLETIQVMWFISLLVISIYHILVFRTNNNSASQRRSQDFPGVSIIIAVRNGSAHIKQHLDDIIHQDYPFFEVIIVDDHSDPEERRLLEEFVQTIPVVRLLTSVGAGKKKAIWTGMTNAKYEQVLCTDADCRPLGKDWIKTMITCSGGHEVVLGYSPYQKLGGLLNRLIRFETVMTGMQYLSWAMKGKPYMSVGRNVLYSRTLFISSEPFSRHQEIPYGDDDLGLQALSGKANVNVCMERDAHVVSVPALSWSQWLKQKHRHMSAGHYYKPGLWWQPGLFGMALIGHWLLLPFLFVSLMWWKWIPVFIIALLMRWLNYYYWTNKLGEKDSRSWYPLLEIMYTAYLVVMGVATIITKRKTWN